MQQVYCSVVPGCPECEASPTGVCRAHNSSGAFMQGIDGEWISIDEGDSETVFDAHVPVSSGEIYIYPNNNAYEFSPFSDEEESRLGWECPRCHACYAPHVDECRHCAPQPIQFPVYPTNRDINGTQWTYTISSTSNGVELDQSLDSLSSAELYVSSDQSE